jgi:hypothetical protein
MNDMIVNARAINGTCLIISWSLKDNFRQIVPCGLRILLEPPSVFFEKILNNPFIR